MTDDDKYYLAFASSDSFGAIFSRRLIEHFGNAEAAWKSDVTDLRQIEGITLKKAETFTTLREKINPDRIINEIYDRNIGYITFSDEIYPYLLKEIHDPPIVLFYKGNAELLKEEDKLAVVGSRKSSNSAENILNKILTELSDSEISIVSGMATGIDTTAHRAAIENNLPTIAVLGSGVDVIYPKSNKKLYEDIISSGGLILSEYMPGTEAAAYRFPMRNRIVSGLSRATLVAEAALKSGALITARLTLEQNRELMCIPGAINNPNTAGIYKLLKEGAAIVTNADDIKNIINPKKRARFTKAAAEQTFDDDNERLIHEILSKDILTIDEIAIKTSLNINDLMVVLTSLELSGVITREDGERYTAV